jgi:hypothetical protein
MKKLIAIIIITIILISLSCDTTEPPPPPPPIPEPEKPELFLTIKDFGVTEVWLKIELSDTVTGNRIKILRDDVEVFNFKLAAQDTLLYENNLQPNITYNYVGYLEVDDEAVDTTEELPITTLNTTRHIFNWEIKLIGDDIIGGVHSIFRDVFIINENDIWAVGEIRKLDSLGAVDHERYGAVHWDGNQWKIMKVFYNSGPNTSMRAGWLWTVFGFSTEEVFASSRGNLMKWNGLEWEEKAFFGSIPNWNGYINKIWGTDENNIYCAGENGTIIYFNGTDWQEMESGTEIALKDIWGTKDGSYVWACGYKYDQTESILLEYDGTSWKTIWEYPADTTIGNLTNVTSVWSTNNRLYFSGARDVYIKIMEEDSLYIEGPANSFPLRIRGDKINDIYVVGERAMINHYNGMNWQILNMPDNTTFLSSIFVKDNIAIAVGRQGGSFSSKGLIYIGKQ